MHNRHAALDLIEVALPKVLVGLHGGTPSAVFTRSRQDGAGGPHATLSPGPGQAPRIGGQGGGGREPGVGGG